jgi:nicotinamide phosphoribosyltransferase
MRIDDYKTGHYLQTPPGTEYVSSYIESRGGQWSEVAFFGLQYYVDTYLTKPIVTKASLNRMHRISKESNLPFNLEGFDYILTHHDGIAPVRVQALKEGSVVPVSTPLAQIVNTDPVVPFITSYMETNLLRVWYPTTVCTLAFHIKRDLKRFLSNQGCSLDGLEYMLHDFGPRGASSSESAMIGGMAHLMNFRGTDNLEALEGLDAFYSDAMHRSSVPASEHSTMTSWGSEPGEILAMENMFDHFNNGIFSIVSDSYDLFGAVEHKYGETLADRIRDLAKTNGKLVVRPDSGDPTTIPVEVVIALMDKFGSVANSKGFDMLPSYLGVLQGDGINEESIRQILQNADDKRIAASNFVFGMGGALLQSVNRDTLKFAMKCSEIIVNGEKRDVFKDPITDKGKTSKKGRLSVVKINGNYHTFRADELNSEGWYLETYKDLLEDVVVNGEVKRYQTREDIMERLNNSL